MARHTINVVVLMFNNVGIDGSCTVMAQIKQFDVGRFAAANAGMVVSFVGKHARHDEI